MILSDATHSSDPDLTSVQVMPCEECSGIFLAHFSHFQGGSWLQIHGRWQLSVRALSASGKMRNPIGYS